MRIACPSCRAVYEVPDSLLAGGPSTVRCARCGTEWVAAARVERRGEAAFATTGDRGGESMLLTPAAGRHEMAGTPADAAASRRLVRLALAGWVATTLVLAGIGVAAIAWRAPIERAWPPSARVYDALGLRG